MKISQRLILGFLAIAMWVAVIGHISLYQLNKISAPLSSNIPESVESISKIAHLDDLAQFIHYNNEVSTQSARNYAFTQDKKWKQRYKDVEPELERVIKEAIEKYKKGELKGTTAPSVGSHFGMRRSSQSFGRGREI